jgi:subtilisin-like proprotein convertase family protein
MKKMFTLKLKTTIFKHTLILLLAVLSLAQVSAQGSLTTTYAVGSGIASTTTGITFVIQNTNATSRVLTQIDQYWNTAITTAGPATVRLWRTTTDLSGVGGGVVTPTWTLMASNTVNVAATGVIPVFTGLSIVLAPGAQYRFAIESTNGVAYGAAGSTPNTITADGVSLKTGDAQIAAQNVGYALNPMPTLANNPRFFAGKITWALETLCSGAYVSGATISTLPSVCPLTPFTLSIANNPAPGTTGLTYQWQSSTTGLAGSYTNIAGATSVTYTVPTQTVGTYYQLLVTCSAGTPTASTPLLVPIGPICYCPPSVINCSLDDRIANVTLGTLNNTSGTTCTGGYSNYTTNPAIIVPDVIKGGANPISVTVGPGGTEYVGVWIDYNKNGNFEATEFQLLGSGNGVTINNAINVPATALSGTTRMRLRVQFATAVLPTQSCSQTSAYGEVEDYTVNIIPCIPTTITAQPPAAVSVTCGASTTIAMAAAGSFPTYQWQYRVSPTSPWINVADAAPFSGATTNTLAITNAGPTLNANQFRVLYAGTCTSPDFTSLTTLTVNPIVAVVAPASAVICQGVIQKLSISNISSPVPGSAVVNSAVLNLNVLDNNPAGVNTSLTIPALPVGAVVVGVRVKLNVTSTWVGDLNVNLKAPNGQILNLSHNLSTTNGNAGGGGSFVNTVIGTAFTTPLHTATSPDNTHTGNYKADAGTITVAGITPNITGFVPTTALWNPLFTTPSGIWTIAMADIFPGADVTTFQNWSLTIDYLLGAPATGVYSGPAGTIFTDATATTAYTAGTPINTVYVKPLATGVNNYSVIVTDGACASLPLTIPVTMYAPVAGTATLRDTTICDLNNAAFILGGTLTGGPLFNHQYQVKTSPTAAWANVANGGVYNGATTNTLTLTNADVTYNGYQYRDSISTGGGCGFLISTVGKLTVNTNPVVTISAAPIVKLFPGLTSTLTAAVSSATAPIKYQWTRNGANVIGAIANSTVVGIDGLGLYKVNVTDANGCLNAASISTPASLTISDSVTTDKLFVYPVPNNGNFQVRYFNEGKAASVVNVFDSKGALVFTQPFNVSEAYQAMNVNLGIHGKGVYRIDVLSSNGNRIKTTSVVVF